MVDYTVELIHNKYIDILQNCGPVAPLPNEFVAYNPGRCILSKRFANYAQEIIDLPVRQDDIWLISYPRTGSTWLQEVVWLLGNNLDFQKASTTLQQIRAPLLELSGTLKNRKALGTILENSVNYVRNLPSQRFIRSHLPLGLLPKQLATVKPRIIYICRNPKDVCVSYYLFFTEIINYKIDFETFCDMMIHGYTKYGSALTHYLAFWEKRHEENILFLKYEDVNADPKGAIKKIAHFINRTYSDEEYEKLYEFLTFDKKRQNNGCNFELISDELHSKNGFKRNGAFFLRNGKVGDWRNYISGDLEKRFDDWIEKYTEGTGLTFND